MGTGASWCVRNTCNINRGIPLIDSLARNCCESEEDEKSRVRTNFLLDISSTDWFLRWISREFRRLEFIINEWGI